MSKEIENIIPVLERSSLTGSFSNSRMWGLKKDLLAKAKPLRSKEILDEYGSDEEDSEDKEKESDSQSDCEDIQQLPDDVEGILKVQSPLAKNSNTRIVSEACAIEKEIVAEKWVEQIKLQPQSLPEPDNIRGADNTLESLKFTDNFNLYEKSQVKIENQKSSSLPSGSASVPYNTISSAPKLTSEIGNRMNPKFRAPDIVCPANNKPTYPLLTSRPELSAHVSYSSANIKFEQSEQSYFSNERRSHGTNTVCQAEPPVASSAPIALASTVSHQIIETPLKNNPPPGSMRPTPSVAHRSMFQTPQSSKLHIQDYAKNQVQTPATIFSNWSGRHMSHTPLQNRPTGDSARAPSILATASSSSHEIHGYRGSEEKKMRRPLAETMQSSVNHRQHSLSEKLPVLYAADASVSSVKHHESPDNPHNRVHDSVKDELSNKVVQQHNQHHGQHEFKENRHPPGSIDKLTIKEESRGSRGNLERMKESVSFGGVGHSSNEKRPEVKEEGRVSRVNMERIKESSSFGGVGNISNEKRPEVKEERRVSRGNLERIKESSSFGGAGNVSNEKRPEVKEEGRISRGNLERIKESSSFGGVGNVSNDNRSEASRHRIESSDTAASRNVRSTVSAVPTNIAASTAIDKNNIGSGKKSNIQLSIPSKIRKSKQGEIITVKNKDYLILGTLGQGMSGHVLRVQDLTSLELRAIKVVDLSRMEKECAQGCVTEISMLYKLQAPCIVKIFDYEIEFPIVHVVMEMGDTDFRNFLISMSEKKQLPLTMIMYYWTEMLTAVKHIHDNNVIHSDLKPANFLLVRGRLKLIDFGIASSINADMTSVVKNSTLGTLNYISPEAFMDVGGNGGDSPNHRVKYKISFKSDVWSLGCILYGLVYGYTPFHNFRSQWSKMQAIMNPNPEISFTLPAGNDVEQPPPILIDVMRKCLQHNPKARPSVDQLLQIAYIPTKQNPRTSVPDIPSNIVMKIKHCLTEDEWRQFTEIMEAGRNQI